MFTHREVDLGDNMLVIEGKRGLAQVSDIHSGVEWGGREPYAQAILNAY